MPDTSSPIGVFDSGVGGLSVLRHIRSQLPNEHLIYFADSGFAPYGDKSEQVVAERSLAVADFMVAQGVKALVVACNTATVSAIKLMRATYPDLPIVGVEPGLKPAAAATHSGKVGVLATARTVRGEKLLQLRDQIAASTQVEFLLQGCPGLVDLIELGELDTADMRAKLKGYIAPLLDQGADTLVLGCTHYVFVQPAIEAVIAAATSREVVLVDTGDAVARRLASLLGEAGLLTPGNGAAPRLHGFTTASAAALSGAFTRLLGLAAPVAEVDRGGPQKQVCN